MATWPMNDGKRTGGDGFGLQHGRLLFGIKAIFNTVFHYIVLHVLCRFRRIISGGGSDGEQTFFSERIPRVEKSECVKSTGNATNLACEFYHVRFCELFSSGPENVFR